MFDNGVLMPSRSDEFIKRQIAKQEEYDSNGNVEAPTGWFAELDIEPPMIARYVSEVGDPWMSEIRNFPSGLFIVKQDSDGLVWAYHYEDQATLDADYAEADAAYAEWLDARRAGTTATRMSGDDWSRTRSPASTPG